MAVFKIFNEKTDWSLSIAHVALRNLRNAKVRTKHNSASVPMENLQELRFLEFKARPERIIGLYQPVRFPKKTPCRFSRQLYTSFQLMGSPVPMVREFVRMGRVIIRS